MCQDGFAKKKSIKIVDEMNLDFTYARNPHWKSSSITQ